MRLGAIADTLSVMTRVEILLWCVALILLEIQHLKWIVWEHWDCRRCGVKHNQCRHGSRLMTLL